MGLPDEFTLVSQETAFKLGRGSKCLWSNWSFFREDGDTADRSFLLSFSRTMSSISTFNFFIYQEAIVNFLLERSVQKYLNKLVWGGHTHYLCRHTWYLDKPLWAHPR